MDNLPDIPTEGQFVDRPSSAKGISALALKSMGHSMEDICSLVGFSSEQSAQNAINKALREEYEADPRSREKSRQMADSILKKLMRTVAVKALDPKHPEHLAAVGRLRELIADHRKMFGLDAPAQVVVHNPSDSEIERWIMDMQGAGTPDLEELDVLDAEVVSDDGDALAG